MLEDMRNMPAPDPHRQEQVIPVRPTRPGDPLDIKAGLRAARPKAEKPMDVQAEAQPRAPVVLLGPNIPGATEGGEPAYPHGAIGLDHFLEVSVTEVNIFPRSNPALRTRIPLGAFLGRVTLFGVQSRAVYDLVSNRWVLTVNAFDTADPLFRPYQFIAVSTTSNALSPYYIYELDLNFNDGDYYGDVQLGMGHDSIIITFDAYSLAAGYKGADMFAIGKDRLYSGLGFSVPLFTGLRGPLAPPIVLDLNPRIFLISAARGHGSNLSLYTLTDSSRPDLTRLTGPVAIAVQPYTAPPPAPQPDGSSLDTNDCRFVNASTQIGDFLWQVHTIDLGGYAAPRFYQINTVTNKVVQSGYFFGTLTSYDFNASIAANSANDIFVTWSMTDPARGTHVQVRYSGYDHNNGPAYRLGPGHAAYTSTASKEVVDWGYYSAVTIDPRNPRRAWLVNEYVQDDRTWGTRIVGIGFARRLPD